MSWFKARSITFWTVNSSPGLRSISRAKRFFFMNWKKGSLASGRPPWRLVNSLHLNLQLLHHIIVLLWKGQYPRVLVISHQQYRLSFLLEKFIFYYFCSFLFRQPSIRSLWRLITFDIFFILLLIIYLMNYYVLMKGFFIGLFRIDSILIA